MRSGEMKEAELLRHYLLGQLADEEVDILEQRLLADGELFELAEAIEGDLLAACARGELSPDEREAVLQRLAATPQGRERLALARSLTTLAGRRDAREPRGVLLPFPRRLSLDRPEIRAAALAASLSVVVAGLWLAQQTVHPGDPRSGVEIAQARKEDPAPGALRPRTLPPAAPGTAAAPRTQKAPRTEPQESAEPGPASPPTAAPTPVQTAEQQTPEPEVPTTQELTLSPTRVRSGQEQRSVLDLRSGTQHVRILIPLQEGDSYSSVEAVVSRIDTGDTVTQEVHEPTAIEGVPTMVIVLPADKLSAGRYRIMLQGLVEGAEPEPLGAPDFEVRAVDR